MNTQNQPMEEKLFPQIDTTKETIVNLIILDKSGSMGRIRNAVVSGFNETLNGIRTAQNKYQESQEHFISLMVFCDCDMHFVYENELIANVPDLELNDYRPCCSTPLYDAMGLSLNRLKEQIKMISNCTVVVTIITDGLENASREFRGKQIKSLVEQLIAEGWTFAYMGTNHNVNKVADELSISNVHEFEDNESGMNASWNFESEKRQKFYAKRNECHEANMYMSADSIIMEKRIMAMNFYNDEVNSSRITPNHINNLAANEIFVFGSNLEGHHQGGASRIAHDKFGAIEGQGVGLHGQSYAIPTTQGGIETVEPFVDEFIEFAKHHPELRFLVTRIGCGVAGFNYRQIAPLFIKAINVENICLPREFWKILIK